MNKKMLEILVHLKERNNPVSMKYLENQFGLNAPKYVQELIDLDYVKETTSKHYARSGDPNAFLRDAPSGLYRITGAGRVYLECRNRDRFERWFTLIAAAIGAVTGILALFR